MKKNILLTAGGTATTWHFCQVIDKYFKDKFNIIVTDINDKEFVPASIYANKFYKVPAVLDNEYLPNMYEIMKKEKIDIIIPLIDFDLYKFSSDNEELKKLNVKTTATNLSTIETLTNKYEMYKFLRENNIPTPSVYKIDEIKENEEYIVKPKTGFGSIGVSKKTGKEIKELMDINNLIFQEICKPDEITVEIYNGKNLKIFQRKRVATKSGVCTKMIPVHIEQINKSIEKLVSIIKCPEAFCVQFMENNNGQWCITDCNLRIGAGTALSTKIGFQLVRALLTSLLNEKVDDSLFKIDNEIVSVLRVYEEISIK